MLRDSAWFTLITSCARMHRHMWQSQIDKIIALNWLVFLLHLSVQLIVFFDLILLNITCIYNWVIPIVLALATGII